MGTLGSVRTGCPSTATAAAGLGPVPLFYSPIETRITESESDANNQETVSARRAISDFHRTFVVALAHTLLPSRARCRRALSWLFLSLF